MPKVSILVPCYNVEKYIRQCIDSIVNQTLKDIEIICINDGSKDNTLSILQQYAYKDDRIKIAYSLFLKANLNFSKMLHIEKMTKKKLVYDKIPYP